MKRILSIAIALLFAGAALAQHNHGDKGPNGGPMQDVAGVHAELLTAGSSITVNIFNEDGKPLSTKTYTGSVLLVSGPNRETVALIPSGENALKGEAKSPITPNAAITLMVKTVKGRTGQARFKK